MNYLEQAQERIQRDYRSVTGTKETAMRDAVRDALLKFAEQDPEFAQAIAQGGSFADCMKAVAKGVGQHISDLEAFEKATRFYFPGSRVRFEMHVDLVGDADGKTTSGSYAADSPEGGARGGGLVIDLTEFL